MKELTEYESNSIDKLAESIHNGKWSNDGLVELFKLIGDYCNLKTISDYAKENNMSYQGVKDHRRIETIFNTKFVIDND